MGIDALRSWDVILTEDLGITGVGGDLEHLDDRLGRETLDTVL